MHLGRFQVVNEVCTHFFTFLVFIFKYVGVFFFNLVIVYSQVFLNMYILCLDVFNAQSVGVGNRVAPVSFDGSAVGSYSLIVCLLENALKSIHLARLPARFNFKVGAFKSTQYSFSSKLEGTSQKCRFKNKQSFLDIYDRL